MQFHGFSMETLYLNGLRWTCNGLNWISNVFKTKNIVCIEMSMLTHCFQMQFFEFSLFWFIVFHWLHNAFHRMSMVWRASMDAQPFRLSSSIFQTPRISNDSYFSYTIWSPSLKFHFWSLNFHGLMSFNGFVSAPIEFHCFQNK